MAVFTPEQVAQFRSEGYVALPSLFTDKEVAAMLTELERFKREGLGRNVATDGDGMTRSLEKVNYQIIPLNDKSAIMRALPFCPKVKACIGELIGEPFARQLDQIFLKPGHTGAGTDWHVDNAYFRVGDPTKATAMWIALHDATLANGTLHVIPCSFLDTFEHERDLNSDHHITFKADEERAVAVELPAGGAAFFNYGTAHATKANNTDRERAGLAYHFVRSDHVDGNTNIAENLVQICGPDASGGYGEYGLQIEGSWDDEVAALIAAQSDGYSHS